MAEICCGVVGGSEASASACKPTSRTARRRRMDIKRFRFVAGVPTASEDPGRKRRRIDCSGPAAVAVAAVVPLNLESDVVGDRLDGEGAVAVGKDLRSSSDPNAVLSSSPSPSPACASMASDDFPRYGVTSVCGRRRDMEDAVSIRPSFARRDCREEAGLHFFGVYDGHGCSHVAVSCKDRMDEVVTEEIERRGGCSGPQFAESEWTAVMEKSFARMDAEVVGWSNGAQQKVTCRCEMQTPKCDHVGSTAVVAVVTPDRIVVANCGDSRAILCRKGVPVPLSSDHKPDRPDELQRIQEAGGRVIYWDGARVLGVLAMSRAIGKLPRRSCDSGGNMPPPLTSGDNYLKPFVISEPEVTVTERDKDDECLILASDGLWDVVPNETACDIVRMCLRGSARPPAKDGGVASPPRQQPETESKDGGCVGGSDKACADAALLLTKLALARQSADNVSVVVVDLRRSSS
ncbi:hypothetical protein Taro_045029 [Colocasia esculenta]|uniref:protein-serine/threonine phosphatase n=1 Tax=Colocasia esculenta TaxID=4460 RepID=A0A843X3L7_COLES|nr:hypothetical protein [Colocasia esculenta]